MEVSGFAYVHFENNSRDDLLDDLSPADIHTVLYDLFNLKSPFTFSKNIANESLDQVTILKWVEKMAKRIQAVEFIPISYINTWPKVALDVKVFHPFLPFEYQVYTPESAFWIRLMEKSNLFVNDDGKWKLSRAAAKQLDNRSELLKMILEGIGYKINWYAFDGIKANEVGQWAFGISLILLTKYGHEERNAEFYAAKYLQFFKIAQELPELETPLLGEDFVQRYIHRTFACFGQIMNLIELEKVVEDDKVAWMVKTTPLFRQLFEIK